MGGVMMTTDDGLFASGGRLRRHVDSAGPLLEVEREGALAQRRQHHLHEYDLPLLPLIAPALLHSAGGSTSTVHSGASGAALAAACTATSRATSSLPTSPHISPHLPISPASSRTTSSPQISPDLPVSPHLSSIRTPSSAMHIPHGPDLDRGTTRRLRSQQPDGLVPVPALDLRQTRSASRPDELIGSRR